MSSRRPAQRLAASIMELGLDVEANMARSPQCGKATGLGWRSAATVRRQGYGRASRIMLNGVSVARRIWVKPPDPIVSFSRANPAWAPRAAPTG